MKLNKKKWLMIGLISLGVFLIIVVVIYFIKKGKKASKIVSDAKKQSDKQQNIDSSNICNYNIKPNEKDSEYWVAEWPNLSEQKKLEFENRFKTYIMSKVKNAVIEYKNWFRQPGTLDKFKTDNEKKVALAVPTYLDKINDIRLHYTYPDSSKKGVIAWVNSKMPYTINFYVPMNYNPVSKTFRNSIYEGTKHEIGHLIDYFFRANGIKTYEQTVEAKTQEDYTKLYLINDADQYARLNFFRGVVGAGPSDSGQELLDKFMGKVKSGLIKSTKYTFNPIDSKRLTQKSDIETAKEVYKKIKETILVGGRHSLNIEQLFANFGVLDFEDPNIVLVNFGLIADLNYTSKRVSSVPFLKLTPIK